MADDVRLLYWDSCLFLDLVNQREPVWRLLESHLTKSLNREGLRIATSTASITEVAFGAAKQLGTYVLTPDMDAKIDSLWDIRGPVDLVEFTRHIAFQARDVVRRTNGKVKGVDAIHVASAIYAGAEELNTYDDDHLLPLGDTLGIPIREPSGAVQILMPFEPDQER